MERAEMSSRICRMKSDIEEMLAGDGLEPCFRADLQSIYAHVRLMYIELGLDIAEDHPRKTRMSTAAIMNESGFDPDFREKAQ